LETIEPKDIRYQRYVLEDGDFIISAKGSKIKTAVFEASQFNQPVVPLGSVMVLRLDPKIYDPYFLKVYLESPLGARLLELAQTGATIVSLNKKNLLEIKVPPLTLEDQRSIRVDYLVARENYSYFLKQVDQKRKELEHFLRDWEWE
jgi:restriction endonuclease S subunit